MQAGLAPNALGSRISPLKKIVFFPQRIVSWCTLAQTVNSGVLVHSGAVFKVHYPAQKFKVLNVIAAVLRSATVVSL